MGGFGMKEMPAFEVEQPIYTKEEADALAESMFRKAAMGYITGEGECRGSPEIKPGVVVDIIVNPDNAGDRFNGKYMVIGATHRYTSASTTSRGGYVTDIRVRRDSEGGEGDYK